MQLIIWKTRMKSKILKKSLWIIYGLLMCISFILMVISNDLVGWMYGVLFCVSIFIDDLKIIRGNWGQFIPVILTILYLFYKYESLVFLLKKIFNW